MRHTTDDDATARNAPTAAMNEIAESATMSETTRETMEGDASATATAQRMQHAIPAPTLRFLLHNDAPLWRFGH